MPVSRDDWFRGSGRAQYLRIKGLELTGSSKKAVRQAGRELLRRVLTQHPDDRLQVTMAHAELADSLACDGDLTQAAEHYRQAMEGEDNFVAHADLGLVEVIVRAEWADQYDEALEVLLGSDASKDPFPATRFRWNLVAARLTSRRGDHDDAKELAKLALRCLEETESPFPRHRQLGLATTDRRTLRELHRLAQS